MNYRFLFVNLCFFLSLWQVSIAIEADNTTAYTSLEQLMESRHSGYQFDASKPIDPKLFVPLANAARLSPSSYNEQPWRFVFCDRDSTPEAYLKALDTIVDANKKWAMDAPLLVIVSSKTLFTKNQKANLWDKFDTGAAVMSFVLEASSLGLMTHEIGGFDIEKIRNEFHVPSDYQPVVIIAVGYEREDEGHPPAKKDRLPMEKNFFLGDWDIPLTTSR